MTTRLISCLGCGITALALTTGAASPVLAAGTNILPTFTYKGVILSAKQLKYSPHDDVIFPSVVRLPGQQEAKQQRYLMYYAPHDTPGGICAAIANDPQGPWEEFQSNPVITREWLPYYKVSHVSGPEVVWSGADNLLFLYFHGENNVTRMASSSDGLTFKYEREVLSTADFPAISEASYGRVALRKNASGKVGYTMFLMGNNKGIRRIYAADSHDARRWTPRKEVFLDPPPGTDQCAGAVHLNWRGRDYIVAHANYSRVAMNTGFDLFVAETDPSFSTARWKGKFLDRSYPSPTNSAVMSPFFLKEQGRVYMYFNVGPRLRNEIALAISEAE